jgi:hypothetical protein
MPTLDDLVGKPDPQASVELVTLSGDVTHAAEAGSARHFPNLRSALEAADTLSPDERERSWIRTSEGTVTLAAAELSLAAYKEKKE